MASKSIEYVKTIDHLESLRNSVNGNPRFKVHFTDGTTALTQTDASVNYGLGNPENIGVPVKVTATPSGRIAHVQPV